MCVSEWVSAWVYDRTFTCYRCPVDDKLISRFRGSWSESGVFETQVFAYMKTFRFTGSPALYIECDVRMCHGRCPVSISQMLHRMHQTDVTCQICISGVWGLNPAAVIIGFLYFSLIFILWNLKHSILRSATFMYFLNCIQQFPLQSISWLKFLVIKDMMIQVLWDMWQCITGWVVPDIVKNYGAQGRICHKATES